MEISSVHPVNCAAGRFEAYAETRATGYAHPDYASSLAEFGTPRLLPRCGGWVLERQIPGTPYRDAMGCYPMFSCEDWSQLEADLAELRTDLVSLTLVPVPFGRYDRELLERCFDRVVHLKDHYVADLTRPLNEIVKRSHRETVRRALRKVSVRVCPRPLDYLDRWVELFAVLARRHDIRGLRAFSKEAFARQLTITGLVMFEAQAEGATVGLDLWYVEGDAAYGHLVAFSDLGYKLRASYATKWHVLQYFADKVRWIDFGGAAGVAGNGAADGLTAFKQGWATGTRPAYLCGRVFQPEIYRELCAARQARDTEYFPAYRKGEFA